MRIEKALLVDFNDPNPKINYEVLVPQHSKRLDFVALNNGIYVLYLVPDEVLDATKDKWEFLVPIGENKIDIAEFDFVQTISIFVPQTDGENNVIPEAPPQVLMFPIFQKRQ